VAPVYDLVTTSVYLPHDALALTLSGSTQWPVAKELRRFGETRAGVTPAKVRAILERIGDAMQDTAGEVRLYIQRHPEFTEIGERMLGEWQDGSAASLRG
jgi:serine/threonine-protein kinase HipA